MLFLYAAIVLFIFYSILITYYWRSWNAVPDFNPVIHNPSIRISVIIPARNEETNIISCLESLCSQDYPAELLQIIVIDDASTDKTWELLQSFNPAEKELFSIRLSEIKDIGFSAHKKRAIQTGVSMAHGHLIVTTDADCRHAPGWVRTLASFYEEKQAVFIAAPVMFDCNSSLLQTFQALDFLTLQGITAASVHTRFHNMCNGANLAYERKAFYDVNGFAGIDHLASGDDMLLMNKIAQLYPGKIFYLKSKAAIVYTQPMKTWKDFFNQRIRWASKSAGYKDKKIFLALLLVYLFNLSFLLLLLAGAWWPVLWTGALYLLLLKIITEFFFVYSVAAFFNKEKLMWLFPLFQPLHIIYTVIAGGLGAFGRYEWKGRKVK